MFTPKLFHINVKQCWSFFRRTTSRTLLVTFFLFLLCYICANVGFTFFNDSLVIKVVNILSTKQHIPDNVFLIDVQYDLELVNKNIRNQDVGFSAITDRQKLYTLLHKLDSVGTYNYIFIDIGFWEGEKTEFDSLLLNQLRKMPRIVIADSDEMDLETKDLIAFKTGKVNYYTSFLNTDFSRYVLVDINGNISFAGKAYEELSNRRIGSFLGIFCHDGVFPAMRCISPKPRLFVDTTPNWVSETSTVAKQYTIDDIDIHLLGSEVLRDFDEYYVTDDSDLLAGSDIIIGNFSSSDEHTTIYGKTYGPILNYNAYLAMCNHEHILFWYQILLILFAIFLLTLHAERSIGVRNASRFGLVRIISGILPSWVFSLLLYFCIGQTFDFMIVSIVLGIHSHYYKFSHPDEKNN